MLLCFFLETLPGALLTESRPFRRPLGRNRSSSDRRKVIQAQAPSSQGVRSTGAPLPHGALRSQGLPIDAGPDRCMAGALPSRALHQAAALHQAPTRPYHGRSPGVFRLRHMLRPCNPSVRRSRGEGLNGVETLLSRAGLRGARGEKPDVLRGNSTRWSGVKKPGNKKGEWSVA